MIDMSRGIADQMNDVKFQADGESAMMYVGTERAANLPKAELVRSNVIEFHVAANARLRSYIKNIVVAVGIDKLYDALMATGEFTTRGIFFDFDSDVLRPESTPVLEEIRATLAEHAELEVVIERPHGQSRRRRLQPEFVRASRAGGRGLSRDERHRRESSQRRREG